MDKNEARIQQEIYLWFNNTYCLVHHVPRLSIFAVPNGGTRDVAEAMSLKATGLRAGVSDLIVLLPGKCLFIEVKTESGKQSPKQIEFEQTVAALGFTYVVVRSLNDFKECVKFYL